MTQPTRWLDDRNTSLEIRELLQAGRRPPRLPHAAAAASIVALAQKTALASAWSLPTTAIVALKATSVGLAVGLGSIAAVTTFAGPHRAASQSAQSAAHATATTSSLPRGTLMPPSAAEPSTVVDGEAPHPNTTAVGSVGTRSAGIAVEAQLLERARSLLGESPERALMLTREHQERFSAGQLRAERELIAIDALLRLGRVEEAKQRARPFLSDGSSQVFAGRIRSLLDQHSR
jgi:hypothetical protein